MVHSRLQPTNAPKEGAAPVYRPILPVRYSMEKAFVDELPRGGMSTGGTLKAEAHKT